tara:strand:+ start:299 stop:673 length:375 start_codon:yes stop_codon:yes gene_type:complete
MAKKNDTFNTLLRRNKLAMPLSVRENRRELYAPPEAEKDTVGIDLENITGQLKYNLWDIFKESMTSYLSEREYSEDTFKNIIRSKGFRLPINLPKGYGIDIDFNKPSPAGRVRDDYRITLKKTF